MRQFFICHILIILFHLYYTLIMETDIQIKTYIGQSSKLLEASEDNSMLKFMREHPTFKTTLVGYFDNDIITNLFIGTSGTRTVNPTKARFTEEEVFRLASLKDELLFKVLSLDESDKWKFMIILQDDVYIICTKEKCSATNHGSNVTRTWSEIVNI